MHEPILQTQSLILLCLIAGHMASGATYSVVANGGGAISNAMAQAKAGDQIVIADGRYEDRTLLVNARGTAGSPIVVRPATPGGVVFTGRFKLVISGEHVVVRDLVFDGCKVADKSIVLVENARNCRLTGCRFTGAIGKKNDQVIRVTAKSSENRIDHCAFAGNGARAVQIRVEETWQTTGHPLRTRIDHNLFQDVPSVKQGNGAPNGRETIQVGQGPGGDCEPGTIVEYNTFLRCNGENECISNKTVGNTYRYNFFKDQVGCLSLRGGARCVVEGNRLENTPGIHVHGNGHTIIHNVIIRSGGTRKPGRQSIAGSIVLGYGMRRQPDSPYPQHYKAATDCLVANNSIIEPPLYGLVIGGGRNQDWKAKGVRNVPPANNRIVNNLITSQTGDLMVNDTAPDNVVERNLVFAGGQATVSFCGQNPVKATPVFVNAAAGDYRLAPGSPGLGLGLAIPGVRASENIGAAGLPLAGEATEVETP